MAHTKNKLNAKIAAKLALVDGRHSDGGGLYMRVQGGKASWTLLKMVAGKRTELSLGRFPDVSLAEAREAAAAKAKQLIAGTVAPKRERRKFGEFALQFIEDREAGWKNHVHRHQWRQTLSVEKDDNGEWIDGGYCQKLRSKTLESITEDDIIGILQPIWLSRRETASRLRSRIEVVLGAAIAARLRSGPNPAALRGNLEFRLPHRPVKEVIHHAAAPWRDVPSIYQSLKSNRSTSALAVCFAVLTAARTGEIIGATWDEVDFTEAVWSIAGSRMKAGRAHSVPLSDEAMSTLKFMGPKAGGLIFPGQKGQRLSQMSLAMSLRRVLPEGQHATPHGMRSAFRDWAGDATTYAREDIEHCLAHAVGNAVERAYRRSTAFDRRREIMAAWATFVTGEKV